MADVLLRRDSDELDDRAVVHRLFQAVMGFLELEEIVVRRDDCNPRLLRLARNPRADAAEESAQKDREERSDKEEDEGFREDRCSEVAPADHPGRAQKIGHCVFSSLIAAAAFGPAIATNA